MFNKRVFRFPGPLIPDADHPPRIVVRRGLFSASVVWGAGRLHPTHPAYAVLRERLEEAGMLHTIEAWLAARRDQFKLRPILGGSVRWGEVRSLPRAAAEPLVKLIGDFFVQAVARPLSSAEVGRLCNVLTTASPSAGEAPMALAADDPADSIESLVRAIDLPHLRDSRRWLQTGAAPANEPGFSLRRACHYATRLRALGMPDAEIAGLIGDLYHDAVAEMDLNRQTATAPPP